MGWSFNSQPGKHEYQKSPCKTVIIEKESPYQVKVFKKLNPCPAKAGKKNSAAKGLSLYHDYYGCAISSLWSLNMEDMRVAWRNDIRRIWGLLFNSHNILLPVICNDVPILDELCFKSIGFVSNCL